MPWEKTLSLKPLLQAFWWTKQIYLFTPLADKCDVYLFIPLADKRDVYLFTPLADKRDVDVCNTSSIGIALAMWCDKHQTDSDSRH